jgi:hypothetical protein
MPKHPRGRETRPAKEGASRCVVHGTNPEPTAYKKLKLPGMVSNETITGAVIA